MRSIGDSAHQYEFGKKLDIYTVPRAKSQKFTDRKSRLVSAVGALWAPAAHRWIEVHRPHRPVTSFPGSTARWRHQSLSKKLRFSKNLLNRWADRRQISPRDVFYCIETMVWPTWKTVRNCWTRGTGKVENLLAPRSACSVIGDTNSIALRP